MSQLFRTFISKFSWLRQRILRFLQLPLHRLTDFDLDTFQKQIKDVVCRYVKTTVSNAPLANNIPLVQIESRTAQINDMIEQDVCERLQEGFGVVVSGVDIGAIELDQASEGYHQLMAVTKNVTATKVEAETTDYVERLRIQREEGQYALHKATQSGNLGAFQTEKQAEVGMAGAAALGKMGANGAGAVSLDGGTGFNPAAMMAGITLGGAVGQNIAGTMNGVLSGQVQAPIVPPPIPTSTYYVALDGQAAGPFDLIALKNMVGSGKFTSGSLVWKAGMAEWASADTIAELNAIFTNAPPTLPTE